MAWIDPVVREEAREFGRLAIGQAVRRGRLSQGMSQRRLAAIAGVHHTTISRLESGKLRGMWFKTLALIVAALNGQIVLHDLPKPTKPLTPEPPPLPRPVPWWFRGL